MAITIQTSDTRGFISDAQLQCALQEAAGAHRALFDKSGKGSDFLGWATLPAAYDKEELAAVVAAAARIRAQSAAVLVIGIGGSYLGARAAIEFLCSPSYNLLATDTPQIYFTGNTLSAAALCETMKLIENKDFSIIIISKSGTTTEPAVAFRVFKALLEEKYGKAEAKNRIYAVTDKARGALKQLADREGYTRFVVPDDIGGRFSVLTPVGLLPIAVSGIDVEAMLRGARAAYDDLSVYSEQNSAVQYAAVRTALYRQGKTTEILAAYEPSFRFVAEWWKQLYGESEGKDGKGIFPASAEFTADLHSLGQYVQDGLRNLFETVLDVSDTGFDYTMQAQEDDGDGLNYLQGKTLSHINRQAMLATLLAHVDGGVPNILLTLEKRDAANFGYLVYFFFLACGMSGYMLGVNPFDQPGVEAYKKNMFALLEKPGFEDMTKTLQKRIGGCAAGDL